MFGGKFVTVDNSISKKSRFQFIGEQRLLSALLTLILFIVLATIASPAFRTSTNVTNILRQSVALGLVAVGQTFVMLSGGFDLSVGSTISLVSVLTALAMGAEISGISIIIVLLLVLSIFIGLLNSFLISKLHLHPFIATFGMMTIIQGITFLITTKPVGRITKSFKYFAKGNLGYIPFGFLILILLTIIAYIILRYTRFGRSVYAVGGDQEVARLSGINITAVLMAVYALAGLSAGITGLYLTSRLGVGSPIVGTSFSFDSITAVVLGGTSLSGGRGSIIGTLIGVFLLILINNGLNLLQVESYWQYVIKAIILVLAVALQKD
jgi:ribose/xylose/arabinose/galactoside ABC-type transport system permease subunit